MKKFISGLCAMAIVSAMSGTSVFADTTIEPKGGDPFDVSPNPASGSITVGYAVDPTYTVTIPAGVTLSSTETQTAEITASNVKLEKGKIVTVKLIEASHTESGSTFHAMTEDEGSTVTYTITANGTSVELGGTVAEFETSTEEQTEQLTFSEASSGETYAGEHTEVLTFGVSVGYPYETAAVGDLVDFGDYSWYVIGRSDDSVTLLMQESFTSRAYNDSNSDCTWATCSLRTYLNNDFYNTFSAKDKAKIALTHNTNPDNSNHGTDGGDDTDDYIYLLSIDEASALDKTIRAYNSSWWWLRSPGHAQNSAAEVYWYGSLTDFSSRVDIESNVRPALTLNL